MTGVRVFVCGMVGLALLSGCSGMGWWTTSGRTIPLSEAQYCAVGHDLAKQIAEHVSVRGIILVSPGRRSRCEDYALHYLRRAGFAVDETGASPTFNVDLEYAGEARFQATASIGRTLRISRLYEPGDGGVYPIGPVSVMRLSARTVWRAPAELIRNAPGS